MKISESYVQFNIDGVLQNKFPGFKKRMIIHSSDSLPVLTNDELYFTDTTFNQKNGYLLKVSKYEFKRLPKPYDTNCQMYGNSTRFQCLNECYFEGYMKTIDCIPNDNSLYTFVLNDGNNEQNLTFCLSENEDSIKTINTELIKNCNQECQDSCRDVYYNTDYEEIISQTNLKYYNIYFKASYYTKIKYSPKMTFISLLIDIANIWSLWHGISFKQIFQIVITYLNFERFLHIFSTILYKIKIYTKRKFNFQV